MAAQHKSDKTPLLVLGLPRTGTSSICAAFTQLGYHKIYHMTTVLRDNPDHAPIWHKLMRDKYQDHDPVDKKVLAQLLDGFDVFTDFPPSAFPRDLIELYPNSKVILTVRDAEGWYKSIRNTFGKIVQRRLALWAAYFNGSFDQLWQMMLFLSRNILPIFRTETEAVAMFHAHNDEVRDIMAAKPDQFLEFDVRQGWEPLCKFLGEPVPVVEFPRLNDTAALLKGTRIMMWIFLAQGLVKYVAAGAGVAVAVAMYRNNTLLLQTIGLR